MIAYVIIFFVFAVNVLCDDKIRMVLQNMMDQPPKEIFKTFHSLYNKKYELESEEAKHRKSVFKKNLEIIKETNAKNLGYTLGVTQFADLTTEEFRLKYLMNPITMETVMDSMKQNGEELKVAAAAARENIDYKDLFIPVRNQGGCGSCWAFTTTAVVEANWWKNNKDKSKVTLSPQQMVDCDYGNHGCGGGWYNNAMEYVIANGLVEEANYPYVAQDGSCRNSTARGNRVRIDDYSFCSPCSLDKWWSLFKQGPVAIAVDADNWHLYTGGVWPHTSCGQINHAVTAVAWSVAGGSEVLTIRNSWGNTWGEQGFMRMQINLRDDACKALVHAYLPKFKNSPGPGPAPGDDCIFVEEEPKFDRNWKLPKPFDGSITFRATGYDFSVAGYTDYKSPYVGYKINFGAKGLTVETRDGLLQDCQFSYSLNPSSENSFRITYKVTKYEFDIQVNSQVFTCRQYYFMYYNSHFAFANNFNPSPAKVCQVTFSG